MAGQAPERAARPGERAVATRHPPCGGPAPPLAPQRAMSAFAVSAQARSWLALTLPCRWCARDRFLGGRRMWVRVEEGWRRSRLGGRRGATEGLARRVCCV